MIYMNHLVNCTRLLYNVTHDMCDRWSLTTVSKRWIMTASNARNSLLCG